MENAGTLVGQRALQFDLSMIEPGLLCRIGPTSDANSVLEFVMNPNHDRGDRYHIEEPSTGKLSFSNHQRSRKTTFSHIHCTSRKLKSDFVTKTSRIFFYFISCD